MADSIDWQRLRAAKEAEIERLRDLRISEVVPSRRDFHQFIGSGREDLAVIGALRRGEGRGVFDPAALAAALDDAEVAALAVATEPLFHGGRIDDLAAAAAACTAPILRDDPLLHPLQVHHSRMHGADACIVAVAWTSDETMAEIVRVAASLHMTAVLGAHSAADAARAARHDKTLVGAWAAAGDGGVDFDRLRRIAAAVPARQGLILLDDVGEAGDWRELGALVDAAFAGRLLAEAADPAAAVAALGRTA